MEISAENIKNISVEEFEKLLDIIGVETLRRSLIKQAENFPRFSIYYNGKKGCGNYWNGFRKENIEKNKVYRFYIDEIYNNKNNLNQYSAFNEMILKKFKLEEINKETISNIGVNERIILSKILNIEVNYEDIEKVHLAEIQDKYNKDLLILKEQYEKALDDKDDYYLEKIRDLNKEINNKNLIENQLDQLTNENNALKQKLDNLNLIEKRLEKILNPDINLKIETFDIIADKKIICNKIVELNNENTSLIGVDNLKLKSNIIHEYILLKLMEE